MDARRAPLRGDEMRVCWVSGGSEPGGLFGFETGVAPA
jgi:hypothetical protein